MASNTNALLTIETAPLALVTESSVKVWLLSTSVSFAKTSIVRTAFSAVVAASTVATGASLVPVTTRVTTLATLCALPAPESSVAVYSNVTVAVSPTASASKFPARVYSPSAVTVIFASVIVTAALSTAVVFATRLYACVSDASRSVAVANDPAKVVTSDVSFSRITVSPLPNVSFNLRS